MSSCNYYFDLNDNIPSVTLFSGKNCSGDKAELSYYDAAENLDSWPKIGQPGHFGNNNNESITVPYPFEADLFSQKMFSSKQRYGTIGSGIYKEFDETVTGVKNNDLESISIIANPNLHDQNINRNWTPQELWDNFRFRCCIGQNAQSKCGGISSGSGDCKSFLLKYCQKHPNDCLNNYCMTRQGSGICDPIVENYCQTKVGKADNRCACFSGLPVGAPAYCLNKNCINFGYHNSNMLKPCNINEINCEQVINTPGNQNIIDNNTFKQYCSSGGNGGGGDISPHYLYLVLFVVVVLVGAILANDIYQSGFFSSS